MKKGINGVKAVNGIKAVNGTHGRSTGLNGHNGQNGHSNGLNGHNGTLRAIVSDDGIGLRQAGTSHQGLGLIGMRERIERAGGALRIQSRPGRGTRLVAEIPIHAAAAGRGRSSHPARVQAYEGGFP